MMMSLSAARRRISVMKQRSILRALLRRCNCRRARPTWTRARLSPEATREFGAVAVLRFFLPVGDGAVLIDLVEPVQDRLVGELVQLLAAKIVVAPLHVADAKALAVPGSDCDRPAQQALQERNVLIEELLLQILGAGGDDDALADCESPEQIGQRLAGTGAGFDDQVAFFFESRSTACAISNCPRRNS